MKSYNYKPRFCKGWALSELALTIEESSTNLHDIFSLELVSVSLTSKMK